MQRPRLRIRLLWLIDRVALPTCFVVGLAATVGAGYALTEGRLGFTGARLFAWVGPVTAVLPILACMAFRSVTVLRLRRAARAHAYLLCPSCRFPLDVSMMTADGEVRCPECGRSHDVGQVTALWKSLDR